MGVTKKVVYGRCAFPRQDIPASMTVEEVVAQPIVANHASFEAPTEFTEPPGYGVIADHLDSGSGFLFKDRQAAEQHLQTTLVTAPLGCVSKQRPGKTWKRRVIMDLRMKSGKQAANLPE